MPWWDLYPAKLEQELQALKSEGITYCKDEDAFAKGICRLYLKVPIGEKVLELEAVFPDLYPYFRFEVKAHTLELTHHQNPFGKNLCLMGRATNNWQPSYTLAGILEERLAQVIQTGKSDDIEQVADLEEHQAEPISDYYSYANGASIIVESNWLIKPCFSSGSMLIGLNSRGPIIRGAVFEVWDEFDRIIIDSDNRVRHAFELGCVKARWIRLSTPPRFEKPDELFKYLSQNDNNSQRPSSLMGGGQIEIRAALFPEERAWRKNGEGWVFVCKYEGAQVVQRRPKKTNNSVRRRNHKKW